MTQGKSQGSSVIVVLVGLFVVMALGFGGWYVWHKNDSKTVKSTNSTASSTATKSTGTESQVTPPSDPSDGGKYMVIPEWGVRVALPPDLQNKLTYKLGDAVTDPDTNLAPQGATFYLAISALAHPEACAGDTIDTLAGPSVGAGAVYLRTARSKPLNTAGMKYSTKVNILVKGDYAFNLNYGATPACSGDESAFSELYDALAGSLSSY
jgi:hypothetical protein